MIISIIGMISILIILAMIVIYLIISNVSIRREYDNVCNDLRRLNLEINKLKFPIGSTVAHWYAPSAKIVIGYDKDRLIVKSIEDDLIKLIEYKDLCLLNHKKESV